MFQGSLQAGGLKSVSRIFQGNFLKVSRVSPECFKCVSRKFRENVQGVSEKFQVACHSSQLQSRRRACLIFQLR